LPRSRETSWPLLLAVTTLVPRTVRLTGEPSTEEGTGVAKAMPPAVDWLIRDVGVPGEGPLTTGMSFFLSPLMSCSVTPAATEAREMGAWCVKFPVLVFWKSRIWVGLALEVATMSTRGLATPVERIRPAATELLAVAEIIVGVKLKFPTELVLSSSRT